MRGVSSRALGAVLLCLTATAAPVCAQGTPAVEPVRHQPAVKSMSGLRSGILAVAQAGPRIVAVGDRGVVLLSDDDGRTYRQADAVPTRATLTSVAFAADGRRGWAAGHWGVVLVTEDAGAHWKLQRDDLGNDQPLFSVYFRDARSGMAVGLWSLLLRTADGGKTWAASTLVLDGAAARASGSAGPNLFSLFASPKGSLLVAAEGGVVYRSVDDGRSWKAVETGGSGSLWAGVALRSGTLLAGGLAGHLYRSSDDGVSWQRIASRAPSSITALAEARDGRVYAVAQAGVLLVSDDDGRSFKVLRSVNDGSSLTAVHVDTAGRALLFSDRGPVVSDAAGR